jgi:hypothetical protein
VGPEAVSSGCLRIHRDATRKFTQDQRPCRAAGPVEWQCLDFRGAAPFDGEKQNSAVTSDEGVHLPGPTDYEAMQDAGAYVNAVAERVDLVAASVRLVQSGDVKIAKSELDRLREMKFGKVGVAAADEFVRADFGDLPRPPR